MMMMMMIMRSADGGKEVEEKEQADSKPTPAAKKIPEVAGASAKCAAQTPWLDHSSFKSRKEFVPVMCSVCRIHETEELIAGRKVHVCCTLRCE